MKNYRCNEKNCDYGCSTVNEDYSTMHRLQVECDRRKYYNYHRESDPNFRLVVLLF